ncbi:HEPN domain-containing protein [bacterium]|nr:HEPN domain-containing protein [bacterium]
MTNYSELLESGVIARARRDSAQAAHLLAAGKSDLAAAIELVSVSPKWSLNASYNAMHVGGRALMIAEGYRPASKAHHMAVVQFLRLAFETSDAVHSSVLEALDRLRRRRNRSTYGVDPEVYRTEALSAIETARELLSLVAGKLGELKDEG